MEWFCPVDSCFPVNSRIGSQHQTLSNHHSPQSSIFNCSASAKFPSQHFRTISPIHSTSSGDQSFRGIIIAVSCPSLPMRSPGQNPVISSYTTRPYRNKFVCMFYWDWCSSGWNNSPEERVQWYQTPLARFRNPALRNLTRDRDSRESEEIRLTVLAILNQMSWANRYWGTNYEQFELGMRNSSREQRFSSPVTCWLTTGRS